MRKAAALISALMLTLFCVGCNPGATTKTVSVFDLTVWTADANDKILRQDLGRYSVLKDDCKIKVICAKNEKEAGQIILTAKRDIPAYEVKKSDLTGPGGAVLSADNIILYNQKYFPVNSAGNDYYAEAGDYPDGLLPFETAVKYRENRIKSGENQGIYVLFDIPENQAPGEYRGNIEIKIGDTQKQVPVVLSVFEACVSETVHSKSAFSMNWYLYRGEVDTSDGMRKTYAEFLSEYLVSGYDIMKKHYHTDREIDYFVSSIAELAKNPKISSLKIPVREVIHPTVSHNGKIYESVRGVDIALLSDYLIRIGEKSFEEQIDIAEKCFIYDIDEPELNSEFWGGKDRFPEFIGVYGQTFKMAKTAAVSHLNAHRDEYRIGDELFSAVTSSIENMPNIVTANGKYGEMSQAVYTPYYSALNNSADLEDFRKDSYNNELWWYGCNVPTGPYPTYHIDDTLLSARLESWMRYEYGIVGNLYWAVDSMSWNGDYTSDYYTQTGSDLEAGEGLLLYPGKPYGLDTPLASLRLEAIRNGLEEYELLRSLELSYNRISLNDEACSSAAVRGLITDALYNGAKVNTTGELMLSARKGLLELSQLAEGASGVRIVDVKAREGRYDFTVYAADGYKPESGGQPLEVSGQVEGGKFYEFSVTPSGEQRELKLSVDEYGVTKSFSWYLGSSSTVYGASSLECGVKPHNVTVETRITAAEEFMDPSEISGETEGEYLRLLLGASADKVQDFYLEGEAVSAIGPSAKKVVLRIYNGSETRQPISIDFKYSKQAFATEMLGRELLPGMNIIEFNNVFTYNWNLLGELEYMRFLFGARGDHPAMDCIYLKSLAVYAV